MLLLDVLYKRLFFFIKTYKGQIKDIRYGLPRISVNDKVVTLYTTLGIFAQGLSWLCKRVLSLRNIEYEPHYSNAGTRTILSSQGLLVLR